VCEDTSGERFRSKGWNRRCVWLCPDGFTSECSNVDGKSYCFYETEFNINQSAIDAGDQLVASGFARGNFNYRIESIGVNFVGSGTRDCADASLPSTCYNAGFIPYSLTHQGPYMVRNHLGQDYEAKLFTGNIEHARGLAAERYLSNPMSDEDRSLVEPYLRSELEGRPLDGNFVLRVWEEDGVDFEGIDDVQIVLNYRYWTRFD
jgi:hypothetical protein